MRLVVLSRFASVAVAMLVVSCFSVPAYAGGCKGYWANGHCYKSKKSAKHVTHAKRKAKREHVASRRSPRDTRSANSGNAKWYGWVVTRGGPAFYHEGQRYAGGTPHGPAMWYNNGEGGFNATVFWKLYERQLP